MANVKDENDLMQESESLAKDSREKATRKKHKMGPWYVPRKGVARSDCETCRAGVTIVSDGSKPRVLGAATVNRCPGHKIYSANFFNESRGNVTQEET